MAIHPCTSPNIHIPIMHPNLAQISRWWVAKTIITQNINSRPFLQWYQHNEIPHFSSLNREARPSNIAPINSIVKTNNMTTHNKSNNKDSLQISHTPLSEWSPIPNKKKQSHQTTKILPTVTQHGSWEQEFA
jgi:hypothetical protein